MPDILNIPELKTKSETASTNLANLQTSGPGMLQDLRSSLASIFAKDNPLIQARDEALSRYLSGGDVARAELLPGNLPQVAGSPLTLSPTQQNAIVSSRQAANLAPLLGLNQAVLAGYGNIGDLVRGAGDIYQSQIQAATTNLAQAVRSYENAVAQDQFNREFAEKQRQFNISEARKGSQQLDVTALLSAILAGQQPTSDKRPPLESFDQPDTLQNIDIPGQGTIQPYTPTPISGPPGRFNILSQLGALPELIFGKEPISATPQRSVNLLGQQNLGPFRQ